METEGRNRRLDVEMCDAVSLRRQHHRLEGGVGNGPKRQPHTFPRYGSPQWCARDTREPGVWRLELDVGAPDPRGCKSIPDGARAVLAPRRNGDAPAGAAGAVQFDGRYVQAVRTRGAW